VVSLIWLVPAIPFASFIILALWGRLIGKRLSSIVGAGSIGLSAFFAVLSAIGYFGLPSDTVSFSQTLWQWFSAGSLQIKLSLYLDPLSVLMILVVTIVGFLIHYYSVSFMADDEGVSRFFAYMNLFVGFMLILVLADNLLFLIIGWEGVGLCSYLLIGFWYKDPANGAAARKAFIVTRIGDVALLIALFVLFYNFKTLDIQQILSGAGSQWTVGASVAVISAVLLLGGAVGKSSQLPLQTWLPDAMAGPTPTSALIHAATMVTAGVYLITRMHVIFDMAPSILLLVAIVGAATLLLAGFAALGQRDIKRVLAYSTISQIGYMFFAMGVGAYSAAMFHFMTHAFFKALLFLGAGVIIKAMDHEHNMYKMGGLKKPMPVTFWTFLVGCASLSAVPLISSGFYSKDTIIWAAWDSPAGSPILWLAGLLGALLTSLYTFRMFFLTFYGENKGGVKGEPDGTMHFPLITLATLATFGGFIYMPETLGGFAPLGHFLGRVIPAFHSSESIATEALFQIITAVVSLGGIYLAYVYFIRRREKVESAEYYPFSQQLWNFFFAGLGFDWLYEHLFVIPYKWIAEINRKDVVDYPFKGLAYINVKLSQALSLTQNGSLRAYAFAISIGALIILIIVVIR
jgi:NADH-quinone oxidoreductase subunit L